MLLRVKNKVKGRALTKPEKDRFRKLSEYGCIVCQKYLGVDSPPAINHIDGKTKVGCHQLTIPLCGPHHQTGGEGVAIHHNKAAWVKKYGTEWELLEYVNERI